jgi:hypothetical protein
LRPADAISSASDFILVMYLEMVVVPFDVMANAILVVMIRALDYEAKIALIAAHASAAVTAWET